MAEKKHQDDETLQLLLQEREEEYILRLYVSGMTPNSQKAITRIQEICRRHLSGRYTLEIIDIYQQPSLAKKRQIIAVPTLVRELPPPLRRFIGDLSKIEKILVGLDLKNGE